MQMRPAVSLVLALVSLAATTGCGRHALVSSDALPLTRVVIYRNGVGYFERSGHVEDEEVRFKMKQTEVGDFLATLAVMERGGSSVRAAAFPLKDEADAEELAKKPAYKKTEDEKKGLETVALSLDGKAHDLVVGYVAESPVWRPSYRLVIHDGGQAELQAWGIVQNLSGEDWRDVKLSLVAGAPLAFDPQLQVPVVPERPVVTDRGEVIAAVPRGETSLREGGARGPDRDHDGIPDAVDKCPDEPETFNGFQDEDGCPDRGRVVVGDEREEAEKKDEAPAAEAQATDAYASGGANAPARKKAVARGAKGNVAGGAAVTGSSARAYAPAAPPPPPSPGPGSATTPAQSMAPAPARMAPSGPRDLRSLAAVAVEAGTTRYDLPATVTVPDKSATMVMLLSRKVVGEASFLFAPDGGVPDSMRNPFRVARFTNGTNGVLERGAIAVFEDGSFLGQGMMDPLPAGASATVPFALERTIAIDKEQKFDELGARISKVENGELTIERDSVLLTKYRVKNGGDKLAKVIIKHPRQGDARLYEPPQGTEDNVGTATALVPGRVPARVTGEIDVDERRTVKREEDWFTNVADAAVKAYLADKGADKATQTKLGALWQVRNDVVSKTDARTKLAREQADLAAQSEETRRNLKAIEKNKQADQLRAKLTQHLGEMATRLDAITKETVELDAKLAELRVRFKDAVREIKIAPRGGPDR